MIYFTANSRLVGVAEKMHLLTLTLDLDTLAEFAVSAKVFRARSVSSHLHSYVVAQINAAKKEVSSDEWDRLVAAQKTATLERSKAKSITSKPKREQLVNEKITNGARLSPNSAKKMPMQRPKQEEKKRRQG